MEKNLKKKIYKFKEGVSGGGYAPMDAFWRVKGAFSAQNRTI